MMIVLRLFLLVVLSSLVVAASHHAWRIKQTYGFFRFFAFETFAILVVWNTDHWFHDPLSIRQLISWSLIVLSIVVAVQGIYLLKAKGRAQARIMEETQTVVEDGAYRYVQHPLYAALIYCACGVFLNGK